MNDVEAVVREHARRVSAGDPRAREDLASDARLTPPDLLDRLLAARFASFEIVAHARIGDHHIFKTRYAGPTLLVVQARWAWRGDGPWRLAEAEVTRTAPTPPDGGASSPS